MPFFARTFFIIALTFMASTALAQTEIRHDVIYDVVDGEELKLDLYFPTHSRNARLPVVVYTHGGCFSCGDKKDVSQWLKSLVDDGIMVASIGYRKAPEHLYPAGLIDAQQAVRFLRAHAKDFNLDPDLIASFGESAGGTIASLLGVHPMPDRAGNLDAFSSPVTAVADWYGRTDLARPQPNSPTDCATGWLGLSKTPENLAQFRAASVMPFVSPASPPFLILHGTLDRSVEPMHSVLLSRALRSAGVQHNLYFSQGDAHGMTAEEGWQLTRDFFLRHLKQIALSEPKVPAVIVSEPQIGEQFSYKIPIANGAYRVRLHFVECSTLLHDQRVFDVKVDDTLALPNYNIARAAGGINAAVVEEFGIIVKNGLIDLSFLSARTGVDATISGIEIIPAF